MKQVIMVICYCYLYVVKERILGRLNYYEFGKELLVLQLLKVFVLDISIVILDEKVVIFYFLKFDLNNLKEYVK